MSQMIKVFDTTLRDGEQSPGCSMNMHEKLEFARQLERLRVDIIEAGFPIASQDDFVAVEAIAREIKETTVAGLCRAVEGDIRRTYDALKGAVSPRIHIVLATSDLHLERKLKMTREEALERAVESVKFAKRFCSDIQFSAEDASRSDKDYLLQVLQGVIAAGATTVNIPDTVGYTTPEEMYRLVDFIKKNIDTRTVDIAVHCHNDLGMATANTFAAMQAGATQIEGTINGIGERAGNVALEEVIMAAKTRKDMMDVAFRIDTKQIYRTSKLLSTIIGVNVPPNKAIVGANAFAHASGIHQHGVISDRQTYEIMKPEDIGIYQNKIVLSKHSGKHALAERIFELGYMLDSGDIDVVFSRFKDLADRKKNVTDKDIEALVSTFGLAIKRTYTLHSFVVNSGTVISATAVVRLLKDEEEIEQVARGDGPIDAAFKAIDNIVKKNYPLQSYSIQSVTEGQDALGEVVVKLKKDNQIITGRGLSTDIIEASIKSYLNALNKALLM